MSIIFTVGKEVDLDNDLSEGHSLTGKWVYVAAPMKINVGNILPGPGERKESFMLTSASKLIPIYCDDPGDDDHKAIKYIDKPTKDVVAGRAATLIYKKIEVKAKHGEAVLMTVPEKEKVKHLSRLAIAQTELAISTGKSEDVTKKDIRAKVNADTTLATTLTDLATSWSVALSDTDKVLIKHIYNAFKVIKYVMAVELVVEAKKAALIAYEGDSDNSDLDVLNYDSSLSELPTFPTLED